MRKTLTTVVCSATMLVGSLALAEESSDEKTAWQEETVTGVVAVSDAIANEHETLEEARAQMDEAVQEARGVMEVTMLEARERLDEAAQNLLKLERSHGVLRLLPSDPLHPGSVRAMTWGSINRDGGFLGLELENAEDGVTVLEVADDSPAQVAQVMPGDIVLRVDKLDLTDEKRNKDRATSDLVNYIGVLSPGTEVNLTLLRDGDEKEIDVVLAERPESVARNDPAISIWTNQRGDLMPLRGRGRPGEDRPSGGWDPRAFWGAGSFWDQSDRCGPDGFWIMDIENDLGQYFNVEYGVLILSTVEGTELRNGDILLSIDGKPVRSVSHAKRFIRAADGDTIAFEVKRKGRDRDLTLNAEAVHEKFQRCG